MSIQQLREIQTKYLSGKIKNHLAKEYGVQHETITKILQTNISDNFTTVSPRFLGEIQDNGCIIFQGGKDGSGYGRYWKNGKSKSVTRAVLAEKLGYEVPTYMDACHTCDIAVLRKMRYALCPMPGLAYARFGLCPMPYVGHTSPL